MTSTRLLSRILLAGTALAGLPSLAHAEDMPPAQAGAVAAQEDGTTPSRNDEIIVTANKRAENVQDVPLAVQVLSPEALTSQGVREFSELTRIAPSLIVRPSDQPVNASISIRGIGTFAFSIGVEPSVAVQVDDVPVTFQARAFADLSDIERIEVLRGPQSTLYGKSASAGLINIVTQAPTKELSGKVSGLVTTDSEYTVGGTLAGPLTSNLGFRVTANYDNFDGNVHNLYTGDKVNGREYVSLKGKLVWDPIDAIKITAGLNYIDGSTTYGRPYIRGFGPTAYLRGNPAQPPSVYAPGVVVGPDNDDNSNNAPAGTEYDGFGQWAKVEADLGGPTLVSVSSHDNYTLDDFLDQDDTSVAAPDNRQGGRFKSDSWTQELRLVSPGNDTFRYTAGIYFAAVDYSRRFTRGPSFSLANWFATSGSEQAAVFGQIDWELVPHLTATGGVRLQHERVNYTFVDYQNGNARFSGAAKDDFATYKAGLQYAFTDDVMLYGSFATGHKGQTYDLTTGFNAQRASGGPVNPETSESWEAGLRTQFLDHRLTVNLTAFTANYDDFQAQGIETFPDGTVNYRLANVGKIRTRGVEFEAFGRIGSDLTLGASAAYLDAEITEFPFAQCFPGQTAAQGCTGSPAFQNLAGARPAQSPEWKLAANADFTPDLGPFRGLFQLAYSYQSEMNFSLSQDPETIQPAFGITNLAVGIRGKNFEVAGFVNNLFDVQYYANMINSRGTYNNQLAIQAQLPRDFRRYGGVRASFSF